MTRVSGFVCIDCREPFVMEKKEIEWYENKEGFEQPKRCRECRKKRREYKVNCLGVTDPRD
jgi:hypothetical protein